MDEVEADDGRGYTPEPELIPRMEERVILIEKVLRRLLEEVKDLGIEIVF